MKFLLLFLTLLFTALFTEAATASALPGQKVTITVTADGTQPFTYQWYRDGIALSGGNSSSFVLNSFAKELAGTYTVQVSNAAGSTLSDNAVLSAVAAPSNVKTSIVTASTAKWDPRKTPWAPLVLIAGNKS